MKILNSKLLFQLFIVRLAFGRPINYEELEKKTSIRTVKSTRSDYLKVQQNGQKEELTAFNYFDDSSNDIIINQPVYNKFNSIHRYHKNYHKDSKSAESVNQDQNNENSNYEYIPDHYIVLFKKDTEEAVISQHMDKISSMIKIQNDSNSKNFEIKHIYNMDGFKGYHGKFDESTINLIKKSSEVFMVEKDQKIRIKDLYVQTNAPWNLSRISRRQLTENDINKEKYLYQHSSGQNVTVYVIDTGINIRHVEFGGRATWGATFSDEIVNEDLNGHGTHVAGIIGGSIYGVAKKVNLVAVKVLNEKGEGSLSDVIQGIEFSIRDHLRRYSLNTSAYPVRSIINFSLGGPLSNILNRAADTAVRYGVNVVTAAGNENEDSCNSSPASSPNAITVAATNANDEITAYSNHGNCVNVFAPGDMIESAWTGSTNNLINISSGTSMACPHVAGVVALLLDTEQYANYKPDKVLKLIEDLSTKNIVKKIPIWSNTPNRLIYSSPPVKGTKFADNDKTNDNDPDNLDDIIDDDDDKPDDLDDIDDDDDDKKNKGDDGVGDIIDDDDDKPDDLDDIDDDDDDQNKGNDGVGDIIDDDDDDDDQNKGNDGVGDIIDDDDDQNKGDDGVGDIIDDDDDQNKGDDGVGDIIDDDDDQNKGDDGVGDIIDDDDDQNKGDDGIGDIIDDDDDDQNKGNDGVEDIIDDDDDDQNKGDDGVGDIIDEDDDDKPDDLNDIIDDNDGENKGDDGVGDIIDDDDDDGKPDDLNVIVDDDNGNDKNKSGDLDEIENGNGDDNNDDNDDLNDIIDDDDDDALDDINDVVESVYSIFKNLFINRSNNNNMDNTVKVRKPLRKDKTYITYYHYEQIKKEFNLKDY